MEAETEDDESEEEGVGASQEERYQEQLVQTTTSHVAGSA